jgi:hypothetical protein
MGDMSKDANTDLTWILAGPVQGQPDREHRRDRVAVDKEVSQIGFLRMPGWRADESYNHDA